MVDQQNSLCTPFRKRPETGDSGWLRSSVHCGRATLWDPHLPFPPSILFLLFSRLPVACRDFIVLLTVFSFHLASWTCTNDRVQSPATALTLSPGVKGEEQEAPLLILPLARTHREALGFLTRGRQANLSCQWPDSKCLQLCRPFGLSQLLNSALWM